MEDDVDRSQRWGSYFGRGVVGCEVMGQGSYKVGLVCLVGWDFVLGS